MSFDIWRGMIEFSTDIQSLVRAGWTISQDYGEQRLRINDRIILTKGERVEKFDSLDELTGFINNLHYEDNPFIP